MYDARIVGVRQHISYQRARCGNERVHGASSLPSRPGGSDARGSCGDASSGAYWAAAGEKRGGVVIRGRQINYTDMADAGTSDSLVCPLSLEIYEDPVVAADGFSYERREIELWFGRGKRTSPKTNEELPHTFLTPNRDLKSACQDFLDDVRKFEAR